VNTIAPDPSWKQLFRVARSLIRQTNIGDDWTFGGGTAMMLQIEHRDSDDVDIFLSDAQLLPLLDPAKNDFEFEVRPDEYGGDGTRTLKLAFAGLGEIDFIVAGALTSSPTTQADVEGELVFLETIPEIVTKKIYHRGASIMPRDIFDIAAACEHQEASVVAELRSYAAEVKQTLAAMEKLNPSFVNGTIAELAIRDQYKTVAETALERAKAILIAANKQEGAK
jgi:Nucleotidyl transferase AbiEii toxin, Type IV TA system